jgi:uncharacterized protein (DUF362 family)
MAVKKKRPEKNPARKTEVSEAPRKNRKRAAKAAAPPTALLPARARVAIVSSATEDKFTLLGRVLEQSAFWTHLEAARLRSGAVPDEFRILIKPDLSVFEQNAATGADPALVERLIDLLHSRGYHSVNLCEGRNSFDLWLENRDVVVLAEMAGYRYVTPGGNNYDVIDLSEEILPAHFPGGGALSGTGLARPWLEADYRICFVKNKTDEEQYYALCLNSLLQALPLRDKDYHYRHRLKPQDVCVELLERTPVHFGVIDAFISNHGGGGTRVSRPIETRTMIASANLPLADWGAARKMGLDPFVSPINAAALREIGLPAGYEIVGDLTPYAGWINVHPLIADSARRRNEWLSLSRLLKPWLQTVDPELFPFKDVVNERLNQFLTRNLSRPDSNPVVFWGMVGLNYALGAAHGGVIAYQTLYDKDKLRWREEPLNFELLDYRLADYEAVVDYLKPLEELARRAPADRNGLRWCYLDKSVLFEFSRLIPARFDDFVARVDIAKSIQFMNDYIGGVAVPVAHDAQGRVTHQAERNLYLPQPNYLVLYQGEVIDVTKLEYIAYAENERKIYWRTIKSENHSAEYDDGIVTFTRTGADETLVTVMGRQLFTLPLFWQIVNLDLNPALKDLLVTQAYTDFFTRTIVNFEAKYEGRDIRIGRPWNPLEGEPGAESGERPMTERLTEIVGKASEAVNRNWGTISRFLPRKYRGNSPAANSASHVGAASYVDEDGFAHFNSARTGESGEPGAASPETGEGRSRIHFKKTMNEARTFLSDLAQAIKKDYGLEREDD